ncbi:hypothetical protein ACFYY5_28990 [Nocardia elegans]|uniref:Uncharacterized protein n=1 Tax=Nocardia elegans TaxID=300029 RepID=A0ABW6TNT1_9NOCA
MNDLTYGSKRTKEWRWRKANGISLYTPAAPVRDHIIALNELNVTDRMIGQAADCTRQYVRQIADGSTQRIRNQIAHRILAVTHHPHPNQSMVLGVGAGRRIRSLNAIGWPTSALAEMLDIGTTVALNNTTRRVHITYERWAAIRDLYERLSGTPGPRPGTHLRARSRSVGPLAWEGVDIDHPNTQPDWSAAGVKQVDRPVCINGHRRTPENTFHDNRGHRQCRDCRKAAEKRKAAKRAAA